MDEVLGAKREPFCARAARVETGPGQRRVAWNGRAMLTTCGLRPTPGGDGFGRPRVTGRPIARKLLLVGFPDASDERASGKACCCSFDQPMPQRTPWSAESRRASTICATRWQAFLGCGLTVILLLVPASAMAQGGPPMVIGRSGYTGAWLLGNQSGWCAREIGPGTTARSAAGRHQLRRGRWDSTQI